MIKKCLKKAYRIMPFKKYLFLCLKEFYTLKKKHYQHLHFNGTFRVKTGENSSFLLKHFGAKVENEIFWEGIYGSWEKESLKLWTNLCSYSEWIFDVGSNSGVYSLLAKTTNPKSKIYAFEPIERVFERLMHNIQINQFDISTYNIGLSNYDGDAFFYDPETEHVYSITINKTIDRSQVKSYKRKSVVVNCFDTWFNQKKISGFDLIKIDVETHEPEVIEGMKKSLARFRPFIIIEVLTEDIANRLNHLFNELEYQYFDINEADGIKKIARIVKSSSFNLFFCPNEKETQLIESGIL